MMSVSLRGEVSWVFQNLRPVSLAILGKWQRKPVFAEPWRDILSLEYETHVVSSFRGSLVFELLIPIENMSF